MKLLPFLLLLSFFAQAQSHQFINPTGLRNASKSYSQVVVATGIRTVYVSGQVALDSTGQIVGKGDFRAQVRRVYENLQIALKAAGATWADVVKTTTFVVNTNPEKIGVVRDVRNQFYVGLTNPPASTYIGVQGLYDPEILVEIEAIAVLPK